MTVAFAPAPTIQVSKTSRLPGFPSIGIVGRGSARTAMATIACYLSSRGFPVHVLDLADNLPGQSTSFITEGAISGQYDKETLRATPKTLLDSCACLIVAVEPSQYKELAWSLSPWMRSKHTVLLYGGGIGAALEFEKYLLKNGVSGAKVAEVDPLFHCEKKNGATIKVHAMRQWGQFASTNRDLTFDCDSTVKRLLPKIESASSWLSRGLCDYQGLTYPIVEAFGADAELGAALGELVNMMAGRCDDIFNHLESELDLLAEAYFTSRSSTDLNIRRMYGAIAVGTREAVALVPKYGQTAPWQDMVKTLTETISTVYVPLYELARLANLRTPAIDSVINMSSVMCGVDFLTHGRTLEHMGLQGLSQREIIKKLNG